MLVHIAQADLTTLPADAIVNPANSLGIMGGGVAGVIKRKGGEDIQREAMASAPIAVGAAVITTAGSLPARFVIHAPTMEEPGMRIGVEYVRRAMRAALIAAAARGFNVVAFPGLGTGVGGVAPSDAARAMVDELRAHKQDLPSVVWLVALDEELLTAFDEAFKNAQQAL
ncbi:MAG: macro domain-containing protein [Myxococcales bacterium]|nr:macro domain-containing protein [Myxococcales bacterium]